MVAMCVPMCTCVHVCYMCMCVLHVYVCVPVCYLCVLAVYYLCVLPLCLCVTCVNVCMCVPVCVVPVLPVCVPSLHRQPSCSCHPFLTCRVGDTVEAPPLTGLLWLLRLPEFGSSEGREGRRERLPQVLSSSTEPGAHGECPVSISSLNRLVCSLRAISAGSIAACELGVAQQARCPTALEGGLSEGALVLGQPGLLRASGAQILLMVSRGMFWCCSGSL